MKTIKLWYKRLIRSKTMMFNAGMAMLMSLEGVFSMLQPMIETSIFAVSSVVLAVGNTFLRVITSKPLKDK